MRWKLLFLAPLLAAAAAAGAAYLLARLLFSASYGGGPTLLSGFTAFSLPPLAAAAAAGVFVYRHTARRRVLQGVASALLSLALFYAVLLALTQSATL